MQVRFRLIQILSMKCIHEFLRVLKLIVIHVVLGVILRVVVSFDSVLKAVISLSTVRINDLIYHLFILIINNHWLRRSADLLRKRVHDSSSKVHDMKYWVYLHKGWQLESVDDFNLLQNLVQTDVLVIQLETQPLNLNVAALKKDLLTHLIGDIFAVTVSVVSHDSLSPLKLFLHVCQVILHCFSDVFCSVSKETLSDTFISEGIWAETYLRVKPFVCEEQRHSCSWGNVIVICKFSHE